MVRIEVDLLGAALRRANVDARTAGIFMAAACLVVMHLDITHVLSMVVGAAGYLLLQALPKVRRPSAPTKLAPAPAAHHTSGTGAGAQSTPPGRRRSDRTPSSSAAGAAVQTTSCHTALQAPWAASAAAGSSGHQKRSALAVEAPAPAVLQAAAQPMAKPEVRKPSALPVPAPVFAAAGWEAEVQELLSRIVPTPESEAAVASIVRKVQRIIRPVLPEAEVTGFACGNPFGGTAFGVAVPEVDIVVTVSSQAAQGRLQDRWAASSGSAGSCMQLDARKLQKSAIRACTDRLVGSGDFKFRRSAFRGDEPKVTLLALQAQPGASAENVQATSQQSSPQRSGGVPISVSVNAATPLRCASLLSECGQIDPRAQALILLVRRWAKDRGLSHAAKGHFSPYCWMLLAIFYLQAGLDEEEGGPLLPCLQGCTAILMGGTKRFASLGTAAAATSNPNHTAAEATAERKTEVGEHFRGFLCFYSQRFDWRTEAVSVRLGRRGPPAPALPLHKVVHDSGRTTMGPSIEDPFNVCCNLGACSTALSLARLHEELARAHQMCSQGTSLSELLEPWAPPEVEAAPVGEED